jgi:hypothetical protein
MLRFTERRPDLDQALDKVIDFRPAWNGGRHKSLSIQYLKQVASAAIESLGVTVP